MDPRTATRLTDELLWSLRRAGLVISTAQAIEAARALTLVPWDAHSVREALAAVVVVRRDDRATFDRSFEAFFSGRTQPRSLWERLERKGVSAAELGFLQELLAPGDGVALLERGADFDHALGQAARGLLGHKNPLQLGFYTHRMLARLGHPHLRPELARLRMVLVDAYGEERADALVALLQGEALETERAVRAHVEQAMRTEASGESVGEKDFGELDPRELLRVRAAVRELGHKLVAGLRVRQRAGKRRRIDLRRTLRASLATGGVPVRLHFRARRQDRPRLFVLCDISDSVRAAARFLLELTYAAQDLWDDTRSFVFVSELGETTQLFRERPVREALESAFSGEVVPTSHLSNYGRVLRAFEERVGASVDRRSTVLVLGDGRSNYNDDGAEVLARLRGRARHVFFFATDHRERWGVGDSALRNYQGVVTRMFETTCLEELETAARTFTRR